MRGFDQNSALSVVFCLIGAAAVVGLALYLRFG